MRRGVSFSGVDRARHEEGFFAHTPDFDDDDDARGVGIVVLLLIRVAVFGRREGRVEDESGVVQNSKDRRHDLSRRRETNRGKSRFERHSKRGLDHERTGRVDGSRSHQKDGLSAKINNLVEEKFVFTLVRAPVERMISNFQYTFMDPKHSESRVNLCHDNTGNPACRLPLPQTRNEIEKRLIEYAEHANINIERDYCMPQAGVNEQWSVQRMMDNLDFVGITERFDENLIVLKEIFNLEYSDILYLSANVIEYNWSGTASGAEATMGASEDGEESKVNGAASLGEDTLSADVQTKVENLMRGSADFQLWDLANEKLDALVRQIPNFQNKLKTFTAFREAAQDHCKAYADGTGDASQCLYADEGCGNQCLNEFSKNQNNLLSALTMAQSTKMLAAPNVENLRSIVDFGEKKK